MSYKVPPQNIPCPDYGALWMSYYVIKRCWRCDLESLGGEVSLSRWTLCHRQRPRKRETELEEIMGRPASRSGGNMLKKWGRCCNPRSTGAHQMLKKTRPGGFLSNSPCTPWFQPRGAAFGFWPSEIRDLIWKNTLFLWETCYSSHRKCIQYRNQ